MSTISTVMALLAACACALVVGPRFAAAQSQALPTLPLSEIPKEPAVAAFVSSFLARDRQAGSLLSPSNRSLYAQGYRPQLGVPHNPEAQGKINDLASYFSHKFYADLNGIRPIDRPTFVTFVDEIGRFSDQTINCAGEIVVKHDLKVEGRFVFETELAKVPVGPEREQFKSCWLNDAILSTELRMLAWLHVRYFGSAYVPPERR